jgi:phospholipase/carboxylesterase
LKEQLESLVFNDWIFRARPGKGGRVLLLLHGWTGDENSMSIFQSAFPDDAWILLPRAPYPAAAGGYSWRQQPPNGDWPSLTFFRPSIEALMSMLPKLASSVGFSIEFVDVVGFSQCGAMTFSTGLLYPTLVRKMGILAGFAPDGADKLISGELFSRKEIFVAHGTKDTMVPLEKARQLLGLIHAAGGKTIYCESEIGHKISATCMTGLKSYLSD